MESSLTAGPRLVVVALLKLGEAVTGGVCCE